MNFHVLTLFPDMVKDGLYTSILKRAMDKGIISLNTVNIRDYTQDKHRKTDDYPFGGGAGLLMQADPVYRAYEAVTESIAAQNASAQAADPESASAGRKVRTIYLSPQGRTFNQRMAEEFSREEDLVFLCGHYEGIDERVLEEIVTDTVSMGDFVLTGGELAAMMMIDAVARLIPGVLHNDFSAKDESFSGYLLEYPQYTRPEVWHGKKVPEELLSGDHKKIRKWRLEKAEERTRKRRPDLYAAYRELLSGREMLLKNKLLYRDMIETIDRGVAVLIYKEEGTLLLYNRTGESYQLMARDADAGRRALEALMTAPQALQTTPDAIITHEPFMEEVIQNFVFTDGTTYEKCPPCVQMSYTRKELLPAPKSDIRLLSEEYAEIIDENYELLDIEGIREHLREGKLYGIFDEDVLAGFAGEHSDGSMGMLFVFPKYRGRGYAMELERFLINETVKRGDTPYCQIFTDNTASLKLQEKLSLYPAKGNICWFVKK